MLISTRFVIASSTMELAIKKKKIAPNDNYVVLTLHTYVHCKKNTETKDNPMVKDAIVEFNI